MVRISDTEANRLKQAFGLDDLILDIFAREISQEKLRFWLKLTEYDIIIYDDQTDPFDPRMVTSTALQLSSKPEGASASEIARENTKRLNERLHEITTLKKERGHSEITIKILDGTYYFYLQYQEEEGRNPYNYAIRLNPHSGNAIKSMIFHGESNSSTKFIFHIDEADLPSVQALRLWDLNREIFEDELDLSQLGGVEILPVTDRITASLRKRRYTLSRDADNRPMVSIRGLSSRPLTANFSSELEHMPDFGTSQQIEIANPDQAKFTGLYYSREGATFDLEITNMTLEGPGVPSDESKALPMFTCIDSAEYIKSTMVFENCDFIGGTFALKARWDNDVRCKDCHFFTLLTCIDMHCQKNGDTKVAEFASLEIEGGRFESYIDVDTFYSQAQYAIGEETTRVPERFHNIYVSRNVRILAKESDFHSTSGSSLYVNDQSDPIQGTQNTFEVLIDRDEEGLIERSQDGSILWTQRSFEGENVVKECTFYTKKGALETSHLFFTEVVDCNFYFSIAQETGYDQRTWFNEGTEQTSHYPNYGIRIRKGGASITGCEFSYDSQDPCSYGNGVEAACIKAVISTTEEELMNDVEICRCKFLEVPTELAYVVIDSSVRDFKINNSVFIQPESGYGGTDSSGQPTQSANVLYIHSNVNSGSIAIEDCPGNVDGSHSWGLTDEKNKDFLVLQWEATESRPLIRNASNLPVSVGNCRICYSPLFNGMVDFGEDNEACQEFVQNPL